MPQFISGDGDYTRQAIVLAATFCGVVGVTDTIYALAASGLTRSLRGDRATRWSQRAGGGVLIAAGVATAAARR